MADDDEATLPVINSPPRIRDDQRGRTSPDHPPVQQQRRQQQQRNTTTTRQRQREGGGFLRRAKNSMNNRAEEKKVVELSKRLEYGAEIFLEKFFEYLSQLPEEDDDEVLNDEPYDGSDDPLAPPRMDMNPNNNATSFLQGITLPAAAVAWLSSLLYPHPLEEEVVEETRNTPNRRNDESCSLISSFPHPINNNNNNANNNMETWLGGVALKDRLSLLRFLLPRVRMIRITRQKWPPELPSQQMRNVTTNTNSQGDVNTTPPRRQRPPSELNCSTISSVNSSLTVDEIGTNNGTTTTNPRLEFLEYMHKLEHGPEIDMRLFPQLNVLILDGVPPTWVNNLHVIQTKLEVLKVARAAVFDLPGFLFAKEDLQVEKDRARSVSDSSNGNSNNAASTILNAPRQYFFPHLTYLKLDGCNIGGMSSLPFCLSKLQNIRYLSLQHNDIGKESTALKGLRHIPRLTQLDLRYNSIQCLPRANLYLGGQLHTLKLSHNQLRSTRGGLDRCYALQELWLDGNCIEDLNQVSGLARLPELRLLRLHNNPVTTMGSPIFEPAWKIQVWTWFQEVRRASSRKELPRFTSIISTGGGTGKAITEVTLSGLPTEREWKEIQDASYSIHLDTRSSVGVSEISSSTNSIACFSASLRNPPVVKKAKTRRAKILNERNVQTRVKMSKKSKNKGKSSTGSALTGKSPDTKLSPSNKSQSKHAPSQHPVLSFSLQDVLLSLQQTIPSEDSEKCEPLERVEEKAESNQTEDLESTLPLLSSKIEVDVAVSEDKPIEDKVPNPFEEMSDVNQNKSLDNLEDRLLEEEEEKKNGETDTSGSSHQGDNSSDQILKEEKEHPSTAVTNTEDNDKNPSDYPLGETVANDSIFPAQKGKVATIKLHYRAPTRLFDALDCDWDELIKRASEGRIPDGLQKSPVAHVDHAEECIEELGIVAEKVFSDQTTDLLAQINEDTMTQPKPSNQSGGSLSASGPPETTTSDTLPNTLPEHVWKDDSSVLSSLGASRDDIPQVSKFQLAEENSFYDGPDSYREMKVVENLKLYFEAFVFPSTVPDVPQSLLEEIEEDIDDWQSVALYCPRIQLWPDDRRRLERSLRSLSSQLADWPESREKFIRLWEEDIIPCGKPALRRLPPNRQIRLGFHGDKLFEGPELDAYSQCRKVLLCLSSKAFYVILREDSVTSKHQQKATKRKFPLPIDKELLFRDSPWPHCVACLPLGSLLSITIGFEFQRLSLKFRNPSLPNSDPFVFVLLTSNKKSTVRILQEMQKAAKELNEGVARLSPGKTTIAIENDSNHVFDTLGSAVVPELLGTVLHYQIVQQFWRKGNKGTVTTYMLCYGYKNLSPGRRFPRGWTRLVRYYRQG